MTSAVLELGETLGRLIAAPAPRLNCPVPLAVSPPLAVLGLSAIPAFAPLAVMLALTLTLFEAVKVKFVLAPQVTASFTLTLPEPALLPLLLWICTLLLPRAVPRVAPVMSPPLAATVKSVGSISHCPVWP